MAAVKTYVALLRKVRVLTDEKSGAYDEYDQGDEIKLDPDSSVTKHLLHDRTAAIRLKGDKSEPEPVVLNADVSGTMTPTVPVDPEV